MYNFVMCNTKEFSRKVQRKIAKSMLRIPTRVQRENAKDMLRDLLGNTKPIAKEMLWSCKEIQIKIQSKC